MGFKKLAVSLVMFSVFVIAILSYGIGYANDNSAVVSVADDTQLSDLNKSTRRNIVTFKTQGNKSSTGFFKSTESDDIPKTPAQFKYGVFSLVNTTGNVLTVGFTTIFGANTGFGFILTAFSGLMIVLLIVYIWKTLKGGNPD
jgi:hypothetical protein